MKKNLLATLLTVFIMSNSVILYSQIGCKITITEAPQVTAPTVGAGAITQPTCAVKTGSVLLSGLPAGNWTLTCSNGAVINGSGTTYNFVGLAAGGSYTFTVANANNCVSPASTAVNINATSCLNIIKTVDKPTPDVGTDVTFTVKVTNNGPSDAAGVEVTDLLPSGYNYKSNTASAGTTYNNTTGVWTVGNLANGASATLTITATVKAAGTYKNTATITKGDDDDPEKGDNTSEVTPTPVPVSDLGITKIVDKTAPPIGDQVTFTIEVTNHGPSTATNAEVTDLLPAGYQFVSATASVGAYDHTTGKWTIGNLANAAKATLKINAKVLAAAAANYVNKAVVKNTEKDPDPGNNEAEATITTPNAIAIESIVSTNNACFGDSNGTIIVKVKGGTGKYYFSKDGGATYTPEQTSTTYTFTGLKAGDYYIVVKDSNNSITTDCP